jgi:hypothetical protein
VRLQATRLCRPTVGLTACYRKPDTKPEDVAQVTVFIGPDRPNRFDHPRPAARFLTEPAGVQLTMSRGGRAACVRYTWSVPPANGELGHRLAALRTDFAALGTRAAGAAEALAATLPPPAVLLDDLSAARDAFTALRSAMLQQAGALSLVFAAEELGTLRDLEPVLAAITAAEEHRARLAAWEEAREETFGVLDRVMGLIHREDKSLPALSEAQVRARELRAALSGSAPSELEHETTMLPGKTRPFAELLALVEGWNALDDDRCAFLQDAITEFFGRSLALAALRGRIGREGQTPPPPRVNVPAPVVASPALRVVSPAAAVAPPATPVTRPVVAEIQRPPSVAPAPVAATTAPPARDVPAQASGLTGEVGDLDPAGVGETTDERREREEELERLAQQTARWWLGARAGWQGLRERGRGFGDAAHDYLKRFPYLLSVPLQKSAEYEGGRLAEGYALLLAHIDKQEEGFVKEALTRLNLQFTTRDKNEAYPLGQELYLYIVAEGRLYKTYPEFVREILHSAVPKPGAWVQGGIVDADDGTRLFMRGEQPGSTDEQTRTLTEPKERLGPHVFHVTLGPLTTRFFTLRLAGETLADPPNVEIKLKENDAPTDHAWLVTLPAPGHAQPAAPRKHRVGGTTLEELGRQFNGFWMGVFNADPSNDRRYELSIILRRKPPPLPPDPKPGAKPSPDRFFGKTR